MILHTPITTYHYMVALRKDDWSTEEVSDLLSKLRIQLADNRLALCVVSFSRDTEGTIQTYLNFDSPYNGTSFGPDLLFLMLSDAETAYLRVNHFESHDEQCPIEEVTEETPEEVAPLPTPAATSEISGDFTVDNTHGISTRELKKRIDRILEDHLRIERHRMYYLAGTSTMTPSFRLALVQRHSAQPYSFDDYLDYIQIGLGLLIKRCVPVDQKPAYYEMTFRFSMQTHSNLRITLEDTLAHLNAALDKYTLISRYHISTLSIEYSDIRYFELMYISTKFNPPSPADVLNYLRDALQADIQLV
jgi:hypothetical protein